MEAFQSIKDAALVECPACHQPKLERLISATSFQLKGGGWYKDLYSSSSKPGTGNKDKSEKLQSKIDEKKKSESSSSTESTKKAD
jgi:putative FmdB family regulatory protein